MEVLFCVAIHKRKINDKNMAYLTFAKRDSKYERYQVLKLIFN